MPTVFVGLNHTQLRRLPFLPPSHQPAANDADSPPMRARLNGLPPPMPASRAFHYLAKRLLDWLIIGLALGLLFPLMLLIGVAIKLDSTGPFIVGQERIGLRRCRRQGKIVWEQTSFPLYYFRTTSNGHAVTTVGRFLRRSSLDQLPQLWNIIKGDLTLVGPRPLLPPAAKCDTLEVQHRLAAIPGMFDTAYLSDKK